MTLGELAKRFGLRLAGAAEVEIRGVCTLAPGEPGHLSFLANPRYRPQLAGTRAAAVVLAEGDAAGFRGNALVAPDPYLAFARIASLFDRSAEFTPGVHPGAAVAPGVRVPASSHVGPQAVIEEGAAIGERVFVGPGSVIRRGASVGDGSRLEARVYVGERVRLGRRVRIEPGAVLGSRGFGLARGPDGWENVPQLGTIVVGDDVEIGANTTIDRGAIGDTVLGNGVKLDNQIQIAHNVHIGDHTAIAAGVGIAGSARIGARCLIGGCTCINGHIEIGDDVAVLGFTMVTKSLPGPGQYSSGWPAEAAPEWRRAVARLRRLDRLEARVAGLARGKDATVARKDEADTD